MKNILLFILNIYQMIVSPLLHQALGMQKACRYEVSCSEFAKNSISKYGVLKGGKMALKRFLSCQPFIKPYATNTHISR